MNRYTLEEFIFNEFIETSCLPKSEAVTVFAAMCGSSYSTVYKWLRDESHYVLHIPMNNGVSVIEVFKSCSQFDFKRKI